MNDESVHHNNVRLSGYLVVTEGCFGVITWNVCSDLYDRLPREKRNPLLEATSSQIIQPFGVGLTERMLAQAGSAGTPTNALDSGWSFQTRQVACAFGSLDWQVGQGLWDAIPEDQREALYGMAEEMLHDYFTRCVSQPLMNFAYREFGNPRP